MLQPYKYKLIATFLLVVFSLNTMAGFACSIGIDMGYNSGHHQHEEMTTIPELHHHESGTKMHHHATPNPGQAIVAGIHEDCCAGVVNDFTQLDKAVTYNNLLVKAPVFLAFYLNDFFVTEKSIGDPQTGTNDQFLRRSCSINDNDIRIAIHSFQI